MSEESVMRQAMETWLKVECQEAGERLIYSLLAIDSATNSAFKISDPGRLHEAVKNVGNLVNAAVNDAISLPPELLTVEERRKIFDIQEEIKRLLEEAERPGIHERPGMANTIIDKLYDLGLLTRKYLLEKVVECQCGKPEEAKPTRFTKGQIIYIKPEFRHIYLDNVTVTIVMDDPEHKQVWVKEVASAVNYEHIEFVYP